MVVRLVLLVVVAIVVGLVLVRTSNLRKAGSPPGWQS